MKPVFHSLENNKGALIALTVIFVLAFSQTSSAALTFQGRACSSNSICDVIRRCDASGCTSSYENCQSCGVATKVCPNGVATAPNVCVDAGGPQCKPGIPVCTAALGTTDPHVILTFTVFTKKNLILAIDPESQTALGGKTLNYKVSLENKNPKNLVFQIAADIPAGWSINIPQQTTVNANSKAEVQFRVTSNETASDGAYPILIGVFNSEINLYGTATATYIVASRGAPSISVTPKSQSGYPGQSLFYNVSVTNNDPQGFDPSTISLRATAPQGFNAVFTPSSIKLSPGETGYVRLDVTSPANETESTFSITLNATANRLAAVDFIEYKIDFCGDSICEIGEEGSCSKDCPADPNFICNGRCESELDDGLAFKATVTVPFNKFVVCNKNVSVQACVQAAGRPSTSPFAGINVTNVTSNCGIGKPCLCAGPESNCNVLCVDTKGIYYLAATSGDSSIRGIVNYSFACPFVDLPEIKALRSSFASAKAEYEKAQSALRESLKAPNITLAKKAEGQPCVDGLSSIISTIGDFVKYLDAVIAWPGKTNTTAARARAADVKANIEGTYNSFCLGVSGLLQIDSITATPVEKGETGELTAVAKNVGNVPYYGFVQCDFTGAQGEKTSANESCVPVSGQQSHTFRFDVNATSAGKWTARCRVFGSLNPDCSLAALHHESTLQFNVSTRETFIVDVSASCDGNLTCSVRTSQPGCGSCISGSQCTKTGTVNGTDIFQCPRTQYGTFNVTGFVLNNNMCKPVSPTEKSVSVRCAGCGDGIVDPGEQCEPPFNNNNQRCQQPQTTCDGKIFGIRDDFGFCTTSCACSLDQYEFSCTRGKCGAECNDGETRIVTLNKTGGCTCVQQCGSPCTWNPCDCEPGQQPLVIPTGPPSVQVSHSQPTSSGQVTLTATAQNATLVEIYVDGFIVKSCSLPQCAITATYEPGTHSYFARASNSFGTVTDPAEGSKTFTIPAPAGQPTPTTNQTNRTTTTNNSISLTTSHLPQSPTTLDDVIITAVASTNAIRAEIYVDGTLLKMCSDFVCSLSARYPAGTHTYFVLAFDAAGNSVANPTTGTKSFTVTQAAGPVINQTNVTTTTNNSISLTTSHSPQSPTTLDDVIITAVASTNAIRAEIYVDGTLLKMCSEFICSLSATYAAGAHTYFVLAFDSTGNSVANPITGSKTFTVTQQVIAPGPNVTQPTVVPSVTQPRLETTSIIVDVGHNPTSITTNDAVMITAVAHGPRSFRDVNIFVDDALKKTCSNVPPSQPCTFRSTYDEGVHTYFASVVDVTNSSDRDPSSGAKSFSVSSIPAAPTLPQPQPPSSQQFGRCFVKIESKNCTFNQNTRRYDISIFTKWDNGTHAHVVVDGTPSKQIYVKNFTHTEQMAGPGIKGIRAEVHNATDTIICFDSTEIYCGPGTSAGKDVDLIFDVKDVVRIGSTDVRIIVVPYKDISGALLLSYTESTLNVSNVRVEGNTSVTSVTGPIRVAEDKSYSVYRIITNLAAGKNISILYRLRADNKGDYKLVAVANYSGKQERITKTIKVTDCAQTFKVLAVGPSNACLEFPTPCDVPPGWERVERCPEEELPEEKEDNTWLIVVLIIVLVVLAVILYRYRYKVREKLGKIGKLRHKKEEEELPGFERRY